MQRKLHSPVVQNHRDEEKSTKKVNNAGPAIINKHFAAGVWALLREIDSKEKGKS